VRSRVAGVVTLLVFAPIAALAAHEVVREVELQRDGQQAVAVVEGKHTVFGRAIGFDIDYSFDASGRRVTGSDGVSQESYARIAAGDRYLVTYVPYDPSLNRLAGHTDIALVAAVVALSAVGLAVGIRALLV
jgi:hypothetical protein